MNETNVQLLSRSPGERLWFFWRDNVIYSRTERGERPLVGAAGGPFGVAQGPEGEALLLSREHVCRSRDGLAWEKRRLPRPWGLSSLMLWGGGGPAVIGSEGEGEAARLMVYPAGGRPLLVAEGLWPGAEALRLEPEPGHIWLGFPLADGTWASRELLTPAGGEGNWTLGSLRVWGRTRLTVGDMAAAATPEALHWVTITQGRGLAQVVYRQWDGSGLHKPQVLSECRRAEACVVTAAGNGPRVLWQEGGRGVVAQSTGGRWVRRLWRNPAERLARVRLAGREWENRATWGLVDTARWELVWPEE